MLLKLAHLLNSEKSQEEGNSELEQDQRQISESIHVCAVHSENGSPHSLESFKKSKAQSEAIGRKKGQGDFLLSPLKTWIAIGCCVSDLKPDISNHISCSEKIRKSCPNNSLLEGFPHLFSSFSFRLNVLMNCQNQSLSPVWFSYSVDATASIKCMLRSVHLPKSCTPLNFFRVFEYWRFWTPQSIHPRFHTSVHINWLVTHSFEPVTMLGPGWLSMPDRCHRGKVRVFARSLVGKHMIFHRWINRDLSTNAQKYLLSTKSFDFDDANYMLHQNNLIHWNHTSLI